jgi:hypothetical protein
VSIGVALIGGVPIAIVEILALRLGGIALRGTPIVGISETSKSKAFHRVQFRQLILTGQIPVTVAI